MHTTESAQPQRVRIQIDDKSFESPTPTTGAALYELGAIAGHRDLLREVQDDEIEEILRDHGAVRLEEGDRLHSTKAVTVIVNGERHEVRETRLSFDDLVKLAYPVPPSGDNILFTITYRHGPRQNPKGTLLEGQSVRIKNKMKFDVVPTDRS